MNAAVVAQTWSSVGVVQFHLLFEPLDHRRHKRLISSLSRCPTCHPICHGVPPTTTTGTLAVAVGHRETGTRPLRVIRRPPVDRTSAWHALRPARR